MPITIACPCGKPLRVGDQHAGKLVKCPVCGATQRAEQPAAEPPPSRKQPAPAAETSDDFEVIEDTSPAKRPAPVKPAAAPAPSRIKAAVAEEEKPAAPGITGQPKKPKKRKKKSRPAGEDDDGYVDRMIANEQWVKRVIRASAYIVLGVVILAGVAILYFGYREDVTWLQEEGGNAKLGLIVLAVFGVAAIGKGVVGLVLGQFLGDDD
jgi:hypothetical protein